MTPFEFDCWQRGQAARQRRDLQLAWFTAWQSANLSRAKKLPPLKRGLEDLAKAGAPEPKARESVRAALEAMREEAKARALPLPKARKERA